jgi:hypothetical protein
MAIVTEQFYIGERLFNRTFSNSGRYVVRDGISYLEACDPAEYNRTYTEGERFPDDEQDTSAAEIISILLGGN